MATNRFVNIGEALLIECSRKVNQRGIIGLTINLTIQRNSDDAYWTGTTWSTLTVLTMSEVDSVNKPGLYEYTGPIPTIVETYFCHAYISSGQYAFEQDETIESAVTAASATLADNETNADIIAKALKTRNVTSTTGVTGSIYKDIKDSADAAARPGAKMDIVDNPNALAVTVMQTGLTKLADAIDTGVTRAQADKIRLASDIGKMINNPDGTVTVKDQNDVTLFTIVWPDADTRNKATLA